MPGSSQCELTNRDYQIQATEDYDHICTISPSRAAQKPPATHAQWVSTSLLSVRSPRSQGPLPTPHHTVVLAMPFRWPRPEHGPRAQSLNPPHHHAETSAADMRSRTGRYECRHHTRPIIGQARIFGDLELQGHILLVTLSDQCRVVLMPPRQLDGIAASRDPTAGAIPGSAGRRSLSRRRITTCGCAAG